MSTTKSGGKSAASQGSGGKPGGGSQGTMVKSAPKPSSQGMSGGKPSSQVMSGGKPNTPVKGSLSKGNMGGVKLQAAVADTKAGKTDPSADAALNVAREAGVPSAEVKVKSRGVGDKTKEKLSDPNFSPKLKASGQ